MTIGYATLKPRWELLEVLASISSYQERMFNAGRSAKGIRWGKTDAWTIVKQETIIEWYKRLVVRFGRQPERAAMSRRTLNYQLAGLERGRYITREQRHTRHRTRDRRYGELDLRPSIIKFTSLGRLWISRYVRAGGNPLASVAVQKIAQSAVNDALESSTSLSSAVDKSIHSERRSAPGVRTAAARRRSSSSIAGAVRRPSKAPVRKRGAGAQGERRSPSKNPAKAPRIAPARRNGRRTEHGSTPSAARSQGRPRKRS